MATPLTAARHDDNKRINTLLYFVIVALFVIGMLGMGMLDHLLKKLLSLGVLQASLLLFYITLSKIDGGIPPILSEGAAQHIEQLTTKSTTANLLVQAITPDFRPYSNPLPHVLMLTAIVVGLATMAVGLMLILRLYKQHGTVAFSELAEKLGGNHDR